MKHGLFEKHSFGDGNRLVYSRVHKYEQLDAMQHHFGIKYAVNGTEEYYLNNKHHAVHAGEFLVVNAGQQIPTRVASSNDVLGLCIHINKGIIWDVYRTLSSKVDDLLHDPTTITQQPLDFFETINKANQSRLGYLVSNIAISLEREDQAHLPSPEIFYRISEELIIFQGLLRQQLTNIHASRACTKKELFHRVSLGKNIIDDTFNTQIMIDELASSCMMSTFHFSRTFKQVFKITPHQYIISRRLEKAKELIKQSKMSLNEIALLTGFADICCLGKSFRQKYGQPPSTFR